ncbi:hypothetical protein [Nesterenkonia massiliensis]|uniref:hypothetical protein n=1 Tax=Nesterenkonia massiliensis TaxID=1232429 RepID=UPI0004074F75|nr:hypothetical protein [Nesterenkonia massiliensis]
MLWVQGQSRTPVVRGLLGAAALLSAVLHLLMLGHGGVVLMAVMAVLAVLCFPCAGHLWRGPTRSTWATLAITSTSMLGIHLWLIASGVYYGGETAEVAAPTHAGHGHGALQLGFSPELVLYGATALALLEAAAAAWFLLSSAQRRHRTALGCITPRGSME